MDGPKRTSAAEPISDKNRVLFWKGTRLWMQRFRRLAPCRRRNCGRLQGQLPVPGGNRALPPPILASLPQNSLEKQTTHYALGPAGYAGGGGVLPADLVGFDRDAETVTANYRLSSGPATLTLIDYPTPQMAEAQEKKIRATSRPACKAQPAFPKPLAGLGPGLAGGAAGAGRWWRW